MIYILFKSMFLFIREYKNELEFILNSILKLLYFKLMFFNK